ncbi:hypothetical protein PPHE_a0963 [Pseudoalteromonas phenolica O-BC30]|nr:hypothetical protein [Pseudoalteromonas phenolica O-BC30]
MVWANAFNYFACYTTSSPLFEIAAYNKLIKQWTQNSRLALILRLV